MNSKKWVSLIASIVLVGHATLGLINGELMLKGGETIEFDAEPLSFLAVVAIEIAVSIYVVWTFLIARDDSSNEKE
ncbi:hypothetical protein [Alteromonas sp.]|uniref:hypothetical protein n=1 Tax=Alteromonas sp. TaxID=232 RepID=UPI00257A0236|nr:hypothetical protein [Alteromonas sp.]NQY19683.1 hypothetical protein [Alteromonas sp.]